MVISKFIGKNCIVPELEANTKAAAVRELTHLLYDRKKIPDITVALRAHVVADAIYRSAAAKGAAIGCG